ncbi:MAG: hypothetical protein IJL91_07085 [Bacteroidales bacterium]|nr:hypothetical protein [Bacteroidales bacterium]
MKKKAILTLLVPVVALSLVACGSQKSQNVSSSSASESSQEVDVQKEAQEKARLEEEAQQKASALAAFNAAPTSKASASSSEETPKTSSATPEPQPEAPKTSGAAPESTQEYPTVVNGIAVSFRNSIANDVTGKWRVAVVIDNMSDPDEYIVDFFKAYIKDPSELLAIINKKTKTTIRVNNFLGDWLDIGVFKYQSGEELDAKKLFGGELIDNYWINKETGEIDPLED